MIRRNRKKAAQEARHQLLRRVLWAIGLVVAIYLLLPIILGDMGLVQYLKMRKTHHLLQQEIQQLSDQNRDIEKEIQTLRSDPVKIESLARERLGLVRPDEVVYQFESDRP